MFSIPILTLGPLEGVYSELPALAARLRELPSIAALALALGGTVVLLFGSRVRRPLAAVGGAAVGFLAIAVAPSWVANNVGISSGTLMALTASALAVLGVVFPSVFLVAAGALPGAFVGATFPIHGSIWLGTAVGAILTGIAALFAARWVAAGAAALLGACLISAALLVTGNSWTVVRLLSDRPFVILAFTIVLAVAGAAFQLRDAWQEPRPRIGDDLELPQNEISTIVDR